MQSCFWEEARARKFGGCRSKVFASTDKRIIIEVICDIGVGPCRGEDQVEEKFVGGAMDSVEDLDSL